MRFLALSAFFICSALSCLGQASREPYTFFKQSIGLEDDKIADIQYGKAVTKVLSTITPDEVKIFGAVYVHASVEDYLKTAQNLNSLRSSPNYLAVRAFSTPPKLSDLEGFIVDDEDIKDLKKCKPGNCQLQLPAESMEDFKNDVNWSSGDVATQVSELAQEKALEFLLRYQKEGNSALGSYYDKDQPVAVVEQFESLLHESTPMSRYLPDLERYLIEYPRAQVAGAQSIFYWERVKFGLKPTLRMNQMVIYRGSGPSGPVNSVAIKQLYASHYFEATLDLSVCAKDNSLPDEEGFYLVTVKASRQAGLTGPKGSIVRRSAVSRARSSLENLLMQIKKVLEKGHEPASRQQLH